MNTYRLRYLCGPLHTLAASGEELVQAAGPAEALAGKTPWPVEMNMDHTQAWAKNPGTSLYRVEAWEARLVDAQDK